MLIADIGLKDTAVNCFLKEINNNNNNDNNNNNNKSNIKGKKKHIPGKHNVF